jgi:hypothetical protein
MTKVNKVDLAVQWLSRVVKDQPVLVLEIFKLGEKQNFSERTLLRAKEKLGLISIRGGSKKAFAQDSLAAIKARNLLGQACADEEEIIDLEAAASKDGYVTWSWTFPNDSDKLKLPLAELIRQREHHDNESKRITEIIDQMIHRMSVAELTSETELKPEDGMIDFEKPEQPLFAPSSNARF